MQDSKGGVSVGDWPSRISYGIERAMRYPIDKGYTARSVRTKMMTVHR